MDGVCHKQISVGVLWRVPFQHKCYVFFVVEVDNQNDATVTFWKLYIADFLLHHLTSVCLRR